MERTAPSTDTQEHIENQTNGLATQSRDRRRNDSREKLKSAAVELFFKQGFEATSIRQIVNACDLTPPAFYNHFETKDDLLREIIREGHEQSEKMMIDALAAAGPSPSDRLRDLIQSYIRFHTLYQVRAQVVHSEFRCLTGTHLSETLAERVQLRDLIEGVVREGALSGHFKLAKGKSKADEIRLATIAIGDMSLRIASWFSDYGDLDKADVEALYASFALRIVGAAEA
ncbi:MAG: TetR/AcrR family transcriptional regulator [Pseudomonadota bacterium]